MKHFTLEPLGQLGLAGMTQAIADLAGNDEELGIAHADWLALLLGHEATYPNDRRLTLRLRHPASFSLLRAVSIADCANVAQRQLGRTTRTKLTVKRIGSRTDHSVERADDLAGVWS